MFVRLYHVWFLSARLCLWYNLAKMSDYLYFSLAIVSSLGLICLLVIVKAWSNKPLVINQWQHYIEQQLLKTGLNHKLKNKQQLQKMMPQLIDLQFKILIIINGLLLIINHRIVWYWLIVGWLVVNLITSLLAKQKTISQKVNKMMFKKQHLLIKIASFSAKTKLASLQPVKIDSLKLVSLEQYQFLIESSQFFDQSTKDILLANTKNKTIAKLFLPIEKLGQVELNQTLTPVIINQLYQTKQSFVAVVDNEQTIGVVKMDQISQINNSDLPDLKQLISLDLLQFSSSSSVRTVIKKMLKQQQLIGLVVEDEQIVGIIELEQLLKSLKII